MDHINGDRLEKARLYRGLTVEELAKKIGVSKQALSQYENEKNNVSFDKLLLISKVLNFPFKYFYQNEYTRNNVEAKSAYFRSLMRTSKKYRVEQITKMEHLALIYSILSEYIEYPKLNLPQSDIPLSPSDTAKILREYWGLGNKPINDMIGLVESNGLIVSKFDNSTDDIDAFSQLFKINGESIYIIALSKNKSSASRMHFDIAHELGHILLHEWSEDLDLLSREQFKSREKEANEFASNFLLPEEEFSKDIKKYPITLDYYIELKRKWKVSIAAMVYRTHFLGIINYNQYQNLMKKINVKKWNKIEPLEHIFEITEPSLLNESIDMLLDNDIFTKEELIEEITNAGLAMNVDEIEKLLNLPKDKLKFENIKDKISLIGLKKYHE